MIGEDLDLFERVAESGEITQLFESACAIVVGDTQLTNTLLSQFTSSPDEPCVLRVDSYSQLTDLLPEVKDIIDGGEYDLII